MLEADCLHCLTVDFTHAPEAVRVVLAPRTDELRDFLCEAGHASLPLLLLPSHNALSLVSTRQNHIRAFRPVLAMIREGLLGMSGWRALRVQIASGSDAGRQLLKPCLAESLVAREIDAFVRDLREAAELSRSCGALSGELSALLRMAQRTGDRVWEETRLGRASESATEIELEALVAERIVEEELVAWQSSYPALRSSRRPVSDADIGPFEGEERHSMVRMCPAPALTKLRSA